MNLPELLLVFGASAMASVHCAAMCGGFSLSLARPGEAGRSVARLATYHAGKLFTYVFIGALAGLAGAALLNNAAVRTLQVAFSALAGALIVVVGLQTLGLVPGQNMVNRLAARLWLGPFLGPILQTFRGRSSLDGAFYLGVFNGFLPCGLVYSFALVAAGTGAVGPAMLVMLAFGLGTVPMLVAVGIGGAALGGWRHLRPALARGSGVLVIALGLITVVRGMPLVPIFASSAGGMGAEAHAHGHSLAGTNRSIDLEPAPAPEFALINQAGRRVALSSFRAKIVVLDFIYTTCTTTCPLLTATFRSLQDALGPDLGRQVALVSITVDPGRDTPEVLQGYGTKWGANFAGWEFLTGSPQEIDEVSARYAIFVEQSDLGLAHTETVLLIDRRGRLRSAFNLHTSAEEILAKVRQLSHEHE